MILFFTTVPIFVSKPIIVMATDETTVITKVQAKPFVKNYGTDGFRQDVSGTIVHKGADFDGFMKITVGSDPAYVISVGKISGLTVVTVPVTDTHDTLLPGKTTTLKLELFDNGLCNGISIAEHNDSEWARTRHWEFYLSQFMHTDLGYTDYQETLKLAFAGHLDGLDANGNSAGRNGVKQIVREHGGGNGKEPFLYTIESSFMLDNTYLRYRNADQIQELLDMINDGRINVSASWMNYVMEAFSAEENARAAYPTNRFLVDKLGIKPGTTMRMNDNPAYSKSFVDIAASAGIGYGIHAMNFERSPYHVERLFHLYYMEGMKQNASGKKNRMLVFTNGGYWWTWGLSFIGGRGAHLNDGGTVEAANREILMLIDELENQHIPGYLGPRHSPRKVYPYDKFPIACVAYGGDNTPPSDEHIKTANALNESWREKEYVYPRILSGYVEEFFEAVEKEYGELIPVETGTEENWWNDGWATTAYESGLSKDAGNLLPAAETLASFAAASVNIAYPYEDLSEAYSRLLIFDEHTWGGAGRGDSPGHCADDPDRRKFRTQRRGGRGVGRYTWRQQREAGKSEGGGGRGRARGHGKRAPDSF